MRNFFTYLLKPFLLKIRFWTFLIKALGEISQIKKRTGAEQVVRGLGWIQRDFGSPAPNFVKWSVLKRWGSDATWIETGTYLGETTEFISKFAKKVVSIEPASELVGLARKKFSRQSNVSIAEGTSEEVLELTLSNLDEINKQDINFWLDGHYSEGITYLGDVECPVPEELSIIKDFIKPSYKVTILIDDVRSFSPTGETISGYPSLSYLVSWADENQLFWTIEHDIFIMTNRHPLT
jgi:hypothetical protein